MTPPTHSTRRLALGRRAVPLAAALLALAACDLPTSIPQVDQRWVVPPQTTTIAVASLLPAGVRIVPDSSAFTLDLPVIAVTRLLSDDCASCVAANGLLVPKPAFVATGSASTALPAGIATATLTGGTLRLVVTNRYNFDPLRPSASARGFAIITVTNGATVIGRDSVNGATTALPVGATLTRTIALVGPVSSSSPIVVSVRVDSPAGDAVLMDAGGAIVASATPMDLRVASAAITVAGRQIDSQASNDLTDIGETLSSHVTGGALLLDIVNPFNVAGTIAVQFSAPDVPTVTKSIVLAAGTTHPTIALDVAELRSLLGHQVTVRFTGAVSSTGGPVTVSPRQAVVVTSRLDATLHTGG